jgi:hypothetical protein
MISLTESRTVCKADRSTTSEERPFVLSLILVLFLRSIRPFGLIREIEVRIRRFLVPRLPRQSGTPPAQPTLFRAAAPARAPAPAPPAGEVIDAQNHGYPRQRKVGSQDPSRHPILRMTPFPGKNDQGKREPHRRRIQMQSHGRSPCHPVTLSSSSFLFYLPARPRTMFPG